MRVRAKVGLVVLLVCTLVTPGTAQELGVDLLPDLSYDESVFNILVVDTIEPGRIHMQLDSAITNIGDGPLWLNSLGEDAGNGREFLVQEFVKPDGTVSTSSRRAGNLLYNTSTMLTEGAGWSEYRLRRIELGGAIGAVLATGAKEAFCLQDSLPFDSSLPNFNRFSRPDLVRGSCLPPTGVSVGWLDLYSKFFPFQWIDVTDLPRGYYWLEAEVDGADHILEVDETNNVKGVRVLLDSDLMLPYPTDLNGSGTTNADDLQVLVDAILEVAAAANADINGDGALTATDVQLLVNAILAG